MVIETFIIFVYIFVLFKGLLFHDKKKPDKNVLSLPDFDFYSVFCSPTQFKVEPFLLIFRILNTDRLSMFFL